MSTRASTKLFQNILQKILLNILKDARLLLLVASVFYTSMAVCIKALSGTATSVPLAEMIFFRTGISALVIGILLYLRNVSFRTKNLPLMATRTLSGLLAMACNFYALGHMTLGDSALLVNTFPLFVALLSFLFLGERPTKRLLFWMFCATSGIALILRPEGNFFNYAGLIALLASFLSAIAVVSLHQAHVTDPSLRIAFYFTAAGALTSTPIMLQNFIIPDSSQLLLLLGAGLFGTVGQITMTRAYGLQEVSRLAPLSYFGVVLSFLAGLLFWGEIPTMLSIAGSLVVILCCIQIARIEKSPPAVVD